MELGNRFHDCVMLLRSMSDVVRPDPALAAPVHDPGKLAVIQPAVIGGAHAICTTA